MLLTHGGNIKKIIDTYALPAHKIIDFSSSINPCALPSTIKSSITEHFYKVQHYPDPECTLARQALAEYLDIRIDNILIGNGSNELIHLVPRALRCRTALMYIPTFSEYELSIRLAGSKAHYLLSHESEGFAVDVKKIINLVPKVDLVILCNPNNPTGSLIKKEELLGLLKHCAKHKTYLFVDEAFIEFLESPDTFSLLKDAANHKYLLVLRSITKFFSLPGLRIGYLVADKELIRNVGLFQPTWSVNIFAQAVIRKRIFDPYFIEASRKYIKKERLFLYNSLKRIRELYPYHPSANFIFCKILSKKINAYSLSQQLARCGIIIRNCDTFKGLDGRFFRVAVKKRHENRYLIQCLERIFK